jgi:aminoglycoside 3-N-acetyltransferase
MEDIKLFRTRDGDWVTSTRIVAALEKVKAPDAKVLYMHTGLTFGTTNPELGRQRLLAHLFELIAGLGVPTLCVPTFTFSFCNGEDYHIQHSRSRMGALNEYIRKLPGAVRSIDPLLSVALVGKDLDLVRGLGKNSIGENSTFDKLHLRGATAKFLFFGASLSECFTYTHYVEERLAVPYRYNRTFTGGIDDGNHSWEDAYTLFVRYRGVVPSRDGLLEERLLSGGVLRREACGDSSIACVDEVDGYDAIVAQLRKNLRCYIAEDPGDRNTEFFARNMVAL